jgi:2-oxoglutarate dehydrogenase E2 component (dihydrolipoamide succinyltransferase)
MAIDVVMPQMGESIAEGTVSRWLKKPGDRVERDEPLLEISTDKVDAEIPSPASGTLAEILVQEGQTVAVNSVVARIAGEGGASAPEPSASSDAASSGSGEAAQAAEPQQQSANETTAQEIQQEAPATLPEGGNDGGHGQPSGDGDNIESLEERRRTKSSPLVRKIAAENNVDISQISGSGMSGRVTKTDILSYLDTPKTEQPVLQPPASQPAQRQTAPTPLPVAPQSLQPEHRPAPAFAPGENVRIEQLSVMRKKIAQHMVLSKQTSAHVTTVFEVDFTNIEKLRKSNKESYAERGVKLTYLPFIVQAVLTGLREFPVINASMDENSIIYKKELNIGIAVALEWGLIVPVVKNADEKNVLGLARTINDLGERARTKRLSPDEVQGGTFTITNPGIYGGLFGTPIINQPQVAILCVGGVKKRPMVMETKDGDFIAIRSMCHLALTFDHRIIDGATADQFMARVRAIIEAGQFTL